MPKNKVEVTWEIKSEHLEWLNSTAIEYNLADESKVARVLLDYAIQDTDADEVFARQNMRCRHCGQFNIKRSIKNN